MYYTPGTVLRDHIGRRLLITANDGKNISGILTDPHGGSLLDGICDGFGDQWQVVQAAPGPILGARAAAYRTSRTANRRRAGGKK